MINCRIYGAKIAIISLSAARKEEKGENIC
jgi:hypothetical protein